VRFPVVLFDLDGTLVDSGPIILASYKHATRTVLDLDVPDDELMALVGGPGLHEQMARFSMARADELVRVYRAHNEPLHAGLLAFPGVEGALRALRAEGHRLGVVTAKRRPTVQLAFETVRIGDVYDVVVGSDDTERHKPFPDPILRALELLGASAAEAAYVGDSPYDIEAARAAGVHAVWVSWGGIHDEERILQGRHPDAIVHSAEELLAALR
jgi:pyrophosphatase PpaX